MQYNPTPWSLAEEHLLKGQIIYVTIKITNVTADNPHRGRNPSYPRRNVKNPENGI
jgi:hypothetical protein